MKYCRLDEIQVNETKPYNNDLLNRKESGDILLQFVESFSEGFVLALNGKWGTGKTTFVKMWKQQMKNEGYETIYYNAWEMDHIDDPLIGLIAEFKRITSTGGEERIKKFTDVIRKVSFSIVPSILSMAAKTYTGFDLKDVIKDGSEKAMDILNECVDKHIEQQKSIIEFKTVLTEYVNLISPDKPVIFIIDELDRCKPDFAVKTLERIKHLFTVKNVVFVLAIDQEQLCHSIRGYYGSENFAADDYLRRFFDFQYNLPVNTIDTLLNRVLERFEFPNSVLESRDGINVYHYFIEFIKLLFIIKNLSIRELEKWMLQTRLIINNTSKLSVSPETLAFLVFFRLFDTVFYNRLIKSEISDQTVLEYLAQNFSSALFDTGSYSANFTYKIIAELIRMKYWDNMEAFHQSILNEEGSFLISIPDSINEEWLRDTFNGIRSISPLYLVIDCLDNVTNFDNP